MVGERAGPHARPMSVNSASPNQPHQPGMPGQEIPEPHRPGFEVELPSTDPQVRHEIPVPEQGPIIPTPPRPDLDPPQQDPNVPSPGRPGPDAPR
jgi:hypothetical protein